MLRSGLKFWKSPRCKIFAVTKCDLKGKGKSRSRKRERELVVVDVDSDHEEPASRKAKNDTREALLSIETKVDEMKEDVDAVRYSIKEILHLNEKPKLPVGLYCILRDAFQCKVCLSIPMNPPIIMSKCCKTIIGCGKCVNLWYTGPEALTKNCPSCRAERGYSETMLLRGLDTFLEEVHQAISKEEDEEDEAPQVLLS